jgi:hypothetical protein
VELYCSFNAEIDSVADIEKPTKVVDKTVPITTAFCQASLFDVFWFEGFV